MDNDDVARSLGRIEANQLSMKESVEKFMEAQNKHNDIFYEIKNDVGRFKWLVHIIGAIVTMLIGERGWAHIIDWFSRHQ